MWKPGGGVVTAAEVSLDHCELFAAAQTPSILFLLPASRFLPQCIVAGIIYPVWWDNLGGHVNERRAQALAGNPHANHFSLVIETNWLDALQQGRCMPCNACLVLLPSVQSTTTSSGAVPVTP